MTHDCSSLSRHDDDRFADFDASTRREIEEVVEAVCAELGVDQGREKSRAKITSGIASTWRDGRRQPLNLVKAGFDAICC